MQGYATKKCFEALCDDSQDDSQKVLCEANGCRDKVLSECVDKMKRLL